MAAETHFVQEEERLLADVRAARAEYFRIFNELEQHALEVRSHPRSIPGSDGTQALANLGNQRAAAFAKYRKALQSFTASVLNDREARQNRPSEARLTLREQEVLTLIAQGKTTRELAETLGIAFKTAACHRSRIQVKLGARNTADLTRAAIRSGLIEA